MYMEFSVYDTESSDSSKLLSTAQEFKNWAKKVVSIIIIIK